MQEGDEVGGKEVGERSSPHFIRIQCTAMPNPCCWPAAFMPSARAVIISGKCHTGPALLTSSVSYSACTKTNSCLVFQLNALLRSASSAIDSTAWSFLFLKGANRLTPLSSSLIEGSLE